MKLLAFDTSTVVTSVALVEGHTVLAESSAFHPAGHSERLLPLVDEVLLRANRPLTALDGLAVGIGPGSFTGVRLGLATAKGLHLATGLPLFGVSSLDALAASAWGLEGPLLAALDARRDEVYASLYRVRPGTREVVRAALHASPEHLASIVLDVFRDGRIAVVGDLDDVLFARLAGSVPSRFVRAPRMLATPLARFVAWEVVEGRACSDDGTLEPTYLRGADAKLPRGVSP